MFYTRDNFCEFLSAFLLNAVCSKRKSLLPSVKIIFFYSRLISERRQNFSEFVCVEVLRPSQPNGVMSSAVSLPNHTFTGQAQSSKRLTSIVHYSDLLERVCILLERMDTLSGAATLTK